MKDGQLRNPVATKEQPLAVQINHLNDDTEGKGSGVKLLSVLIQCKAKGEGVG